MVNRRGLQNSSEMLAEISRVQPKKWQIKEHFISTQKNEKRNEIIASYWIISRSMVGLVRAPSTTESTC